MNPSIARFKVQGMHCQSCATNIDWELEDLEGVADARTSLAAGLTEVNYDAAKLGPAELLAAIQKAGFSAEALG